MTLADVNPSLKPPIIVEDPRGNSTAQWVLQSANEIKAAREALDQREPLVRLDRYLFGNYWWQLNDKDRLVDADDLKYLFFEAVDQERRSMERLKTRFSGTVETARKREPIPEEVRIFVWRRDEGKCVRCGSSENLEFDHVIPFSLGGSNSARNLQLLCEPCNRSKGANI